MKNISDIFDKLNPPWAVSSSLSNDSSTSSMENSTLEPDLAWTSSQNPLPAVTSSRDFETSTFAMIIGNNFSTAQNVSTALLLHDEVEPMATWKVVLILIPLLIISLAIILGNLLVIVAVFTQKSLRSPQNIYIVSLAGADMAVALLVLPFNITTVLLNGVWKWGTAACRLYLAIDVSLCTASILHLCAIAIDRYRAITDGVNYIQKRNIRSILSIIICIWIISFWIGTEPVLDSRVGERPSKCDLPYDLAHQIHLAIGALFFPLCIMSFLYFRIYGAIKERLQERAKVNCVEVTSDCDTTENPQQLSTKVSADGSSSNGTSSIRKSLGKRKQSAQISAFLVNKKKFSLSRERKAARTLGLIMGAFIVCWLPLGFMNIIASMLPKTYQPGAAMFQILTWLGYVNSGLNPIIYAASNQEFKKGFRRVLRLG